MTRADAAIASGKLADVLDAIDTCAPSEVLKRRLFELVEFYQRQIEGGEQ